MLSVGDHFPEFSLQALVSLEKGQEFSELSRASYEGRWFVLFFWPMDFTFVCPTELAEFARRSRDFEDRDVLLVGASTDTHYVHLAWRQQHPDLRDLSYPMLADIKKELASACGVLHRELGVALRATFVVDPQGIIRWVCVNDLSVGRSIPEVLRAIDGLQSGELCACNWEKGQSTLLL